MFLKFQYIRMKKLPASEKRMILQDDFVRYSLASKV